eukprot:scaffold40279_cov39-Phaeocystis_antarctica.AAC.2
MPRRVRVPSNLGRSGAGGACCAERAEGKRSPCLWNPLRAPRLPAQETAAAAARLLAAVATRPPPVPPPPLASRLGRPCLPASCRAACRASLVTGGVVVAAAAATATGDGGGGAAVTGGGGGSAEAGDAAAAGAGTETLSCWPATTPAVHMGVG